MLWPTAGPALHKKFVVSFLQPYELIYKLSKTSELSLQRYLQNDIDVSLIIHVQFILLIFRQHAASIYGFVRQSVSVSKKKIGHF